MKWLKKLFEKPTDPGAAYIAKLNREAKRREAGFTHASGGYSSLDMSNSYREALTAMGAYGITADKIQSGSITSDKINELRFRARP